MQKPPQITFVDTPHTDLIETRVRERIDDLEKIFDRIIGCAVRVRAPHQRHRKGTRYLIDIEVETPGYTLVVDHDPGAAGAHEDPLVAVRDAFNAMERQLRRRKAQSGGRPVVHAEPLRGRIDRLETAKDFGQIATDDGRLIYFHRNAVIGNGFDELKKGDPVELSVDPEGAEEGPHASMVRPISEERFGKSG